MSEGILQVVIAAVISNAVALTALGFLVKSLIGHFLDKEISLYKSKLEAENLKLQIAYGGIFEKQANTILELYSKLLVLELGASPGNLMTVKQWNDYRESIQSAATFYHEQRVMIPQTLDEKVLETIERAHSILASSTNEMLRQQRQTFAEDFRRAKDSTLQEMRKLLSVGVHETKKS